MTDSSKHARPSFRSAFVAFASFLMIFYWLVVATYPAFFFFNPFDEPWWPRQLGLLLSLAGWVAIAILPAAVLFAYALGNSKRLWILPTVAIFWPATVIFNQLLLAAKDGQWYLDYLINTPVFIATDVVLPMLLLVLYSDLKVETGKHAHESAASRAS